ncbi:MAG: hypothetical protein ACRDUB_22460, partial [Mycobacterium sp.]
MRTLGAALGVIALLAAGCTEPPTPEPEPKTAAFESAPCPVPNLRGVPSLDLGPEFSCGFLVVPEDRARPDGRTIKIAVARARATSANPKPDPMLYVAGGPGGPGLPLGNTLVAAGINRDRDVILIDQRGTLHAQPALTCPEIDEFVAAATGMSIMAPSTAEKDLAAVRACHARLVGDGNDLASFDTSENASDIADLRTALGLVVSATLNTSLIPSLPKVIHAIATGDPAPAAALLLGSLSPPDLVGYGLTYGVFCRESVAFTDTASILAAARRVLPRLPSEVLSLPPQAPQLVDECAAWNVGRADAAVHE